MSYFRNTAKRARRRAWPIHFYCGPNGGGKSACMVWDTLPSLEAGRPVLGTVRLLDYANPRECDDERCEADPRSGHYVRSLPEPWVVEATFAVERDPVRRVELLRSLGEVTGVHRAAHPLWVPLRTWDQLLKAQGCDVLLDEVTGVASSRESMAMPAPVANKLVQLRRDDVVVRVSAPAYARADVIVRECAQAVTYCKGHLAATVPGDESRAWRSRRLFRWRTYDASEFEDFTAGKRETCSALVNDWHYGPRSPVWVAYDTFDSVGTVGTVSERGRCYRCGGTRTAPKCSCGDLPAGDLEAGGGGPEGARTKSAPVGLPSPTPGRRVRVPSDLGLDDSAPP